MTETYETSGTGQTTGQPPSISMPLYPAPVGIGVSIEGDVGSSDGEPCEVENPGGVDNVLDVGDVFRNSEVALEGDLAGRQPRPTTVSNAGLRAVSDNPPRHWPGCQN
jgi:hypothetical protein